jgi:hypothetical protein
MAWDLLFLTVIRSFTVVRCEYMSLQKTCLSPASYLYFGSYFHQNNPSTRYTQFGIKVN